MTNQSPTYKEKLERLRKNMAEQGVDGCLIPRADEFQGEFVAAYAERLKWLTGFTGSAGSAVVLVDQAAVLTDARYTLQAEGQLDGDLYKVADISQTKASDWVKEQAGPEAVIGFDPWLVTPKQLEGFEEKGIQLKALPENLVDAIWADQPDRPVGAVEIFPEKFAGRSAKEKREKVAEVLQSQNLEAFMITLPDSIAWLLNVRGVDINYIPIVLSYALIRGNAHVQWFVDPQKISGDVQAHLGGDVEIIEPSLMPNILAGIEGQIGLDFKRSPLWFKAAFEKADVMDIKDPCIQPKSIKTSAEQEAIKAAHIRDAVSLVEFLAWFEEEAPKGELTELDIAAKLYECRDQHLEFRGLSFPTIAGYGSNGAIVHYRASEATNKLIQAPGFLLIDSGGQYIDGTTDITRTISVGEISEEMKQNFTRVLKGHIAVATAEFEPGTIGKDIDALARQSLQEVDLDFAHGTGHGVGCYLAVHEEAANLSPKGENALEAGMLLSNEPGYYKEGEYGIRIENLILCKALESGKLGFETVSYVPIDRRAIDVDMLEEPERQWINDYHERVFALLIEELPEDLQSWLEANTAPL